VVSPTIWPIQRSIFPCGSLQRREKRGQPYDLADPEKQLSLALFCHEEVPDPNPELLVLNRVRFLQANPVCGDLLVCRCDLIHLCYKFAIFFFLSIHQKMRVEVVRQVS
jgi:hypothetical protein